MSATTIRTFAICLAALTLGFLSISHMAAGHQPPGNDRPMTAEERLRAEVDSLLIELQTLRAQLAESQLEAEAAQRELLELQQFIRDHDVYGSAYEEYQQIREIAEREDRRRQVEATRQRREAERAERQQRMEEARAQRERERQEAAEARRMRQAGFTGIGMNVYVSKMAYHYAVRDGYQTRIRFDPWVGFYTRLDRRDQIDFSEMTISGSVVNGTNETRNIGIAITFFDEYDNQVGHEIVQIDNARPSVPYPFTSTLSMALNREFASSTSYVLYSDPIDAQTDEPAFDLEPQVPANDEPEAPGYGDE